MFKIWDDAWSIDTLILVAKSQLTKVILTPCIYVLSRQNECEVVSTLNLVEKDLLKWVHKTRCSHVSITLSKSSLLIIPLVLNSKLSIFIASHHVKVAWVSKHCRMCLSTRHLWDNHIEATALGNIIVGLDLIPLLVEQLQTELALRIVTPYIDLSIFSFSRLLRSFDFLF